jgi:hypothetical protein
MDYDFLSPVSRLGYCKQYEISLLMLWIYGETYKKVKGKVVPVLN